MTFGAKPKLALRCCGVLMALASVASMSLVSALSFGCYGVAVLLARIQPLPNAYRGLSLAYDRFLDRLGQTVLRDARYTPSSRVIVSISLSAIPIFVIHLVLGKNRLV